jgi:DNA-binding NarL/FixJ family response regulator
MPKKLLFIVDDDEMLSAMLADYLSMYEEFSISAFSTGEDCLKQMHKKPYLVILDFNLNSVDPNAANGLQILKAIKRINNNTFVIMYSSQAQYGAVIEAIGKQALDYVIKDKQAFLKIGNIIENLSR